MLLDIAGEKIVYKLKAMKKTWGDVVKEVEILSEKGVVWGRDDVEKRKGVWRRWGDFM